MRAINITGERYGLLVVVEKITVRNKPMWMCQCDCGSKAVVRLGNLRSGNTRSCGCGRANANKKRKAENLFIVDGDDVKIVLSDIFGNVRAEAIIDAIDIGVVRKYRWALGGNNYVIGSKGSVRVLLHRFLLGASPGILVDHRDGNPLNNRRDNIRLCDATHNLANSAPRGGTSRFKGVYFDSRRGKWCSRIQYRGKVFWLGRFDTQEEAAREYDKKSKEIFGEFARPNGV